MAANRTFSIIKPDATRRNLTGAVTKMLEEAGLRVVASKRIQMTKEQAMKILGLTHTAGKVTKPRNITLLSDSPQDQMGSHKCPMNAPGLSQLTSQKCPKNTPRMPNECNMKHEKPSLTSDNITTCIALPP